MHMFVAFHIEELKQIFTQNCMLLTLSDYFCDREVAGLTPGHSTAR